MQKPGAAKVAASSFLQGCKYAKTRGPAYGYVLLPGARLLLHEGQQKKATSEYFHGVYVCALHFWHMFAHHGLQSTCLEATVAACFWREIRLLGKRTKYTYKCITDTG